MKKYALPLMAGFAVVVMLLTACKKDYYQDTGHANGKFNGTVLQYLQAKPEYFSDLLKVIKLAGMEDIFQKENITFFAPANPCFDTTLKYVNAQLFLMGKDTIKTLEQVPPVIWREMLGRYIFKGKLMLNDIPQVDFTNFKTYNGVYTRTYDGQTMHLGVVYNSEGGAQYVGYRQLHISYDPSPAQTSPPPYRAPVASVNIEPTNGVVHALAFTRHPFGFSWFEFLSRINQYGLLGK